MWKLYLLRRFVPSRLGSRSISSFFWASLGPTRPSIEAGELIMVYNKKTKSSMVAPAMKRMGFAIAIVVEVMCVIVE